MIDTRSNTVKHDITVGDYPIRVAASPDGNRIFVTNFYGNTVSVINVGGAAPWVERTIPVPYNPMEIAVKPGGRYLYVSIEGNMLSTVERGSWRHRDRTPSSVRPTSRPRCRAARSSSRCST